MLWSRRIRVLALVVVTGAIALAVMGIWARHAPEHSAPVMIVLRGIADPDHPRGQLDDQSALVYARRTGFKGEVLDVAGNTGPESEQVKMALDRIRRDQTVAAIYGFSGGGYNARTIWKELTAAERQRIRKLVVIGSPGVAKSDFAEASDVLIKSDPPEGHMAGPKALLEIPRHQYRGGRLSLQIFRKVDDRRQSTARASLPKAPLLFSCIGFGNVTKATSRSFHVSQNKYRRGSYLCSRRNITERRCCIGTRQA